MEPRSQEQLPSPMEYTPQVSGEGAPEGSRGYEQQDNPAERRPEQLSQPASPLPAAQPIQLPVPVSVPVDNTGASIPADDMPSVAGDDDLIEKEWVDKAKKVIDATRDDPYERERAVAKLQADYLRKRYGKELGGDTA